MRALMGAAGGAIAGMLLVFIIRGAQGLVPSGDGFVTLVGASIGAFIGMMANTGGFAYILRGSPPLKPLSPGFWRALGASVVGALLGLIIADVLVKIQNPEAEAPTASATANIFMLLVGGMFGTLWGAGVLGGITIKAPKPGLNRAVPAAILTFLLGCLFVYFVRGLQNLDPVWDPAVALVTTPFFFAAAFIWGMGGFDPRMSAHAHPPEEVSETAIVPVEAHDDHHEPEPDPIGILTSQIWVVSALSILVVVILFALALFPHGLMLRQTNDEFGSAADFATGVDWLTPLGLPLANGSNTFQADELSVFIGFVVFTLVSVMGFAGLLGALFYVLNQNVAQVRTQTKTTIEDPENYSTWWSFFLHVPLRLGNLVHQVMATIVGNVARGLRSGIPAFFGQK
jgi:heme/copper-type cytochrome/quinol oxidase subunit 3